MKPSRLFFAHAAAVLLLSACGGGGADSGVEPEPLDTAVPDSATASTEAYTQYAVRQIDLDLTRPRDEPLNVEAVTAPPTSETAEPMPLD